MPTLNIEGRNVQVDDSFLKLSADQQNATVDEIAKSLPKSQPSITDAVTDIPSEIANAASEGWQNIKGLASRGEKTGVVEGLMTLPKAVMGAGQVLMSPVTGTARSVGGHLMAAGERLVGENVVNPVVESLGGQAQHPNPQKMYEAAKGDVDLAMSGLGSRGAPVAPLNARLYVGKTPEVVQAGERLADATGAPINVPNAIASDNIAVQRVGQGIRNIPIVGDAIPRATQGLVEDLGSAVKTVADQYGSGSGPNVASRIGRTIGTRAEQEAQAARAATEQSDAAVLADWERAHSGARQAIGAAETNAADAASRVVGDMSPQDMGETLIARLRQGEQAARANKERLYGIAGQSGGSIYPEAISGLRSDVIRSLDESGVVVDPVVNGHSLTPAAARMVAELDNVPGARFSDRVVPRPDVQPVARAASAPASGSVRATAEAPKTQSLLEFLASRGGLGADAELEAIGAHGHTVNVEGLGRRKLVRQGGFPLDYAREAAEEAGYLRGDHKGTSSTRDLLDAIDAEIRGQKRFPEGFEGYVGKRQAVARSEREQHELDVHARGLQEDLKAAGYSRLAPDVRDGALKHMADGMNANSAVERALLDLDQHDVAFGSARPTPQAPVDMQTLELTRKRLSALSQGATNDADRRAARQVMRAYDDWLNKSFDNALFHGSDEALQAYKAARAANTEWRQRFGFNGRDDADKIVNRIVTGEVTPQEVANYIVGATKVGAKGVSSRLLTRLTEATGGDPEALQAIRGGVWNRLSQSTEGAAAKPPAKIINDISEFLQGSGRDVANRLFTPEQQGVMRAYVDTLRRGAQARETLDEAAKNSKPSAAPARIGPMQELADTVLGKGGKTDEALFNAIDSYAKAGGRADVQTLADIVRNIPVKDRGDLAGSIIRNLGVSPRTGQFSPDVFASQWKSYTPQAKAILFGNAGPQRQAIDDIMTISERLKQVGQKFGNPSGTAQNVGFTGLAASVAGAVGHAFYGNFVPALTLMAGVTGGSIAARILASPAGASSAAKWTKAYAALTTRPSAHTIAAYQVASRNLANTAQALGSDVKLLDFMRALQSPSTSSAQDQQNIPRPPGQ